jgi:hypothetical protein
MHYAMSCNMILWYDANNVDAQNIKNKTLHPLRNDFGGISALHSLRNEFGAKLCIPLGTTLELSSASL